MFKYLRLLNIVEGVVLGGVRVPVAVYIWFLWCSRPRLTTSVSAFDSTD